MFRRRPGFSGQRLPAKLLQRGGSTLKRVAQVSMFPESCGGGAGIVARELARHLASRLESLVLCPGERTELSDCADGTRLLTVASAGADELYYPLLDRRNVGRVFGLLDGFGPDVVHAHDSVSLGALAQVWALTRNVPFVLTLHVQPDRIIEFGAGERARLLMKLVGQPLARPYLACFYEHCDAVIAPNQSAASSLDRLSARVRVFMIPNGRDLGRFSSCRIAESNGGRRNLCFIGFLSERKNQLFLLEVLRHLRGDYHLDLVGKALSPGYERRLRECVRDHDLGNVRFLGSVDYSEVPSVLEQAHVFVSASRLEVQSLVVIEALASGTPVVGLANETIDELVDNAVGRRLPADAAPAEFARCVQEICGLPQSQYEEMCRRARGRVARMAWSSTVAATVHAYERLLADRKDATPVRVAPVCSGGPKVAGNVRARLRALGETLRARMKTNSGLPAPTRFYAGLNSGICSTMWLLHRRPHLTPATRRA